MSESELMKTNYASAAAMPPGFISVAQTWAEWQRDVLAILRRDFREVM